MREISLYATWLLAPTRVTANAITGIMIVVGLVGAALFSQPGLGWAVAGALMIQVYLMLDCTDGEIARWKSQQSITGVYLDRLGHYLVEASLMIGLGARAAATDGQTWLIWGFCAAFGVLIEKAETDLVDVARARAGHGAASDEKLDHPGQGTRPRPPDRDEDPTPPGHPHGRGLTAHPRRGDRRCRPRLHGGDARPARRPHRHHGGHIRAAPDQHPVVPAVGALTISWVLLTQGGRDDALAAAIDSIRHQDRPPEEIVVVVNGPAEIEEPDTVRLTRLPRTSEYPRAETSGAHVPGRHRGVPGRRCRAGRDHHRP